RRVGADVRTGLGDAAAVAVRRVGGRLVRHAVHHLVRRLAVLADLEEDEIAERLLVGGADQPIARHRQRQPAPGRSALDLALAARAVLAGALDRFPAAPAARAAHEP